MADIEAQSHGITEHLPASTTATPQSPQPPVIVAAQPITLTNDRPHEGVPPTQIAGNPDPLRGEKYGDPSDGLWSMYLTEAEKQDKDVTESWKGDTEGILVFTGLFSATVAAFIIESYKLLSPDPSQTTNALLTQISGQLVNISNGTPLASIVAKSGQPFKPTASAVRVNVLWFLSLVLSLTCALSATLMQQWARRYQELAQHHGAPHRRARMRAYVFDGISKFGMARAVATMPTILHISVFLFFAGLIDFLFPIDKTVSYFTLGWVAAFALAYTVLTILPNLYLNCPYATPLSGPMWRLSQFFVVIVLKAALRIEGLFRHSLLKLWSRVNQHVTAPGVEKWRGALKNQVKVHRQWLSEGLRKSIERNAKDAPSTVVASALEWTLTALDEDKEIETFAAGVPGFFDSRTVPDATLAILPLMSEKSPTDAILGSRLYDLFKTCIPGASPLNDEERKRRLRVCLKCLCYFGRAFNQFGTSEPLPSYFPRTLASPEIIRRIQTERDPVIHVMGLCFGALVVTKLAADVRSSTGSNVQVDDEQLACLSAILGTERPDVRLCLTQPGVVQLASMVSLALDSVASLVADAVPSDVLDVVRQTLDIVSQTLPAEETIELPFNWSNAQTNIMGGKFDRIIASRLRKLLRTCISDSSTLTDEVRKACLRMCLKNLWSYAKAYHQLGTSKQLPPYFLHAIATPEITRRIQQEEDLTSRMIGYCFEALVVTKLAVDINSGTVRIGDQELACLSGILGAENHDIEVWLKLPGAIEHMSLFFLALGEVGSMDTPMIPFATLPTPAPTMPPYNPILGTNTTPYYPVPGTNISPYYPVPGTNISPYNPVPGANMTPYYPVPGTNTSPYYPILPGTNTFPYNFIPGTNTSPYPYNLIPGTNTSPYYPIPGTNTSPYYPILPGTNMSPYNAVPSTTMSPYNPIPEPNMSSYYPAPGATHAPMFPTLGISDREKLDVWDVVEQTFNILFHTLPAGMNTKSWPDQAQSQVGKFGSKFETILQNWLNDLLRMSLATPWGLPPPTNETRITCLKSLWYHEIACHRLRVPGSSPAMDLFPIHFITPEIASRLHTEEDPTTRVIGRCFVSLVVNRFAVKFDPSGDRELASLSAIFSPDKRKAIHRHLKPSVVQLVNVVSLASNELSAFVVNTVPSDVQHIVGQTIGSLTQALPAELKVELHLDQTDAPMNIPDSASINTVIVSLLRDLLKSCALKTLPLPEEVRTSCLETCLRGLWYLGKELQRLGDSRPLAPEFLDLANPEITRHIRTEKDEVCRVTGRCVEALVVSHLAARTDPTVQISSKSLGRISAILGTESHDSRLWLGRPDATELANMVSLLFSEIEALFSDSETAPTGVLDMIQRTLSILSPALLAELKAELNPSTDETSSYAYSVMDESNSRMALKYLWHCARAYNRLGASTPLPSFVGITLASPGITGRIRTARDINARVTGRCFGALIVNKLVEDFKLRASFRSGVYDAELACISSILDTVPEELLRWSNPSPVIKLLNVVSLMSGEIETLLTEPTPMGQTPTDMLKIVQQTINIITQDLVLGGAFAHGDLPMDQVSLLREICSKIANARPENRFRNQTMGILDQLQQISKQLTPVERRMRRCRSSIFGPQLLRGRVNLATQPEYEARRKRSKSI